MAVFSPIMQYHSEFNHHQHPNVDRTPWNIAERWNDPTVIETYREFAQLRRRLVPYLAQQVRGSVRTGRPLMRPLFFDYPNDEQLWSHPLQYQLGDELIVAPITEPGAEEIDVHLPAGQWFDLRTGDVHTGETTLTKAVPLNEIAVFGREDARATALWRDIFD